MTQDMRNRLDSLIYGLQHGLVDLTFAEKSENGFFPHCFFWDDVQTLEFFNIFDNNMVRGGKSELNEMIGKMLISFDWHARLSVRGKYYVVEAKTTAQEDFYSPNPKLPYQSSGGSRSSQRSSGSGATDSAAPLKRIYQTHDYRKDSLSELVHFVRVTSEHYKSKNKHDKKIETVFGMRPQNFLKYFTQRFPALVTTMYMLGLKYKLYGVRYLEHVADMDDAYRKFNCTFQGDESKTVFTEEDSDLNEYSKSPDGWDEIFENHQLVLLDKTKNTPWRRNELLGGGFSAPQLKAVNKNISWKTLGQTIVTTPTSLSPGTSTGEAAGTTAEKVSPFCGTKR